MALLISLLEVALVTETLAMNLADMMVVEVACHRTYSLKAAVNLVTTKVSTAISVLSSAEVTEASPTLIIRTLQKLLAAADSKFCRDRA